MKIKIVDLNKSEKGSKELPVQFSEAIRDDLVQRAVLSLQAEQRQAYGTKHMAGMRHAVDVSRRRRDYRTSYGHGISRVPRKTLNRSGIRFSWVGAQAPGTVGGRTADPPKAEKDWTQKINEQENRKAIRSAMAATMMSTMVSMRGHRIPKEFPFILDNKVETLAKTSDVEKMLEKLGFEAELARTSERKVRAGKGKNRGRKYQNKKGPLFVVSHACALEKAARNIPGIEVVEVKNINAELLAPGCQMGRLTLWSEGAIDTLADKKLFTAEYKGESSQKPKAEKVVAKTEKKATKKAPAKKTAKKKAE